MKKYSHIVLSILFLLIPVISHSAVVKEPPGGIGTNIPPNVLIILDNSGSMLCPAYFKTSGGTVLSCSGPPGTGSNKHDDGYDANTEYYGYFDYTKRYTYTANKFIISASGEWDGNFLNWVSMRRIDVAKKVLVGGNGFPKARPALSPPNSISGHVSTASSFGNYAFIKKYDNAGGTAAGLFPSCGTTTDCYFGIRDGYIYLDDDTSPFSAYTDRYSIDINITTEWESGVVQKVSGSVRLGLEFFNSSQGGFIDQPMGGPPLDISFVNAIENVDPDTSTPLAESLYTATGYFATDPTTGNSGPRYFNSPSQSYSITGSNADPFDFPAQDDVSCVKSFVIMITDGAPTSDGNIPSTIGNNLGDVALWAHTNDLRADIPGDQTIVLYTVFAFGTGPDELKDAAVNGGFTDKNGNKTPDIPLPSPWSNYTGSFTSNEWDKNADGIPDNYFEAESGSQIKTALLSAFQSILALSNTVTAPVVMPGASAGDGNFLYASSFLPDMEHQWIGRLKKFPLDANGFIQGTAPDYIIDWDAGEILGNKCSGTCISESFRNIFTANNSLISSTNNFTVSNGSTLMPLLGTADLASTERLINFVRGIDTFDEDMDGNLTEDRWKLADIFNSRPIEAGIPPYYYDDSKDNNYITDFKTPLVSRKKMLYAGGNDGMLHAFDASTGEELWAFIPPIILADLKSMISPSANKSLSQYFVDSSPIVEDVFTGGAWKTILISGLRWGGRGYFTLDITDPVNPDFLWALSTDGSTVTHWDNKGTASDVSTLKNYSAYKKMGYSWSEPTTARIRVADSDKWVGVIGGGYRAIKPDVDFDLADHAEGVGRQVYVFDLENGALIGNQNESVINDETGDGIDNSIPSSISVIGNRDNYMQYLYTGDREGQLWKVNISGSVYGLENTDPLLWNTCKLLDLNATYADPATSPTNENNNRRYIYAQPELSEDKHGNRWVFLGTGDGRNMRDVYPKVSTPSTINEGNVFVALREIAGSKANPALGDACETTLSLSDLTDVTADGTTMSPSSSGWYIKLGEAEKSFTPPLVYNNSVFFTTFVPDTTDVCTIGSSYLYIVDYTTGGVVGTSLGGTPISTKKISIGSGIATAPVIRGNVIQIGVTGDATKTDIENIKKIGGDRKDPIITISPDGDGPPGVKMILWKEL